MSNNDELEENINEIEEALEEHGTGISEDFQQDKEYTQWDEAHEKYDAGNEEMLENMVNSLGASHALKSLKNYDGAFSSKGKYLDYNEWHTTSYSGFLIGLAYVMHALVLTVWIGTLMVILKHSWTNCKDKDHEHWLGSVAEFGYELPYYVGTAFVVSWFFEEFTAYELVLSEGGTMAQVLVEVLAMIGA